MLFFDNAGMPIKGVLFDYRSKTDLPWGIHLPESFDYPKEKSDIRQGHLRFTDWTISSGYSHMDWYRYLNCYRSNNYIYNK